MFHTHHGDLAPDYLKCQLSSSLARSLLPEVSTGRQSPSAQRQKTLSQKLSWCMVLVPSTWALKPHSLAISPMSHSCIIVKIHYKNLLTNILKSIFGKFLHKPVIPRKMYSLRENFRIPDQSFLSISASMTRSRGLASCMKKV